MKKLATFSALLFICSLSFSEEPNLISGWDGYGENVRPDEAGWLNTAGDLIVWGEANGVKGCRFRDNTPGYAYVNSVPFTGRHLMLRWDNDDYFDSYYAYPVILEPHTSYRFTWDYLMGGSAEGIKEITAGISTNLDIDPYDHSLIGRLSKETFQTSGDVDVWLSETYEFQTGDYGGKYYMTMNGDRAWYGVANLVLIKLNATGIREQKALSDFHAGAGSNGILVDFHLPEPEVVEFFVYDTKGTTVFRYKETFPAGNNQKELDGRLASGIYLVRMICNNFSANAKVVIK